MVSLFIGMGGRVGLGGCVGVCADTVLTHECNANKITKAVPGNKNVHFLFIVDFFFMSLMSFLVRVLFMVQCC